MRSKVNLRSKSEWMINAVLHSLQPFTQIVPPGCHCEVVAKYGVIFSMQSGPVGRKL